jgi:carboxymethylenebutenolidase
VSQSIEIQVDGGAMSAYVARPAQFPASAVVVLHEIFGVNKDMRETCQELAAQGFIAICPDLFWRQEPGIELNSLNEEEWKKGFSLYSAFDRDQGVKDILATLAAARGLEGSTGKVGVMGFCLGGLMAYLTAVRGDVDAAVAYHGGETDKYLDEAGKLTTPLLMHLADEDEFIAKEAQDSIKAALADKPNAKVFGYAGCQHAFARHNGAHYDAAGAALANDRTWTFLKERLA